MFFAILAFLFCCGLTGGLLVGIAGAGSTVIILPTLIFLFPTLFHSTLSFKMALTTTLATASTAAIVSTIKHYQLGNINKKLWLQITPIYCITSILGPTLVHFMPTKTFHVTLAIILIIYSFIMLYNQFTHPSQQYNPIIKTMNTIYHAIIAGFTCSMGGVATGMIMVPYLTKHLPRQRAVGTSVAAACVGCLIATTAYIISGLQSTQPLPRYSLGYIYLPAYAVLALGIVIGTPIGMKLSNRVKLHGIKIILATLLICSAVFILFNTGN
jgi:uncharacterized protein